MKSIVKILSITAISSLMVMSKCGKDKPQIDDETQTIEDNVVSEQEFMRIVPTTNDRAIKQKGIGGSGKILGGGPSVLFRVWDRTKVTPTFDGWSTLNTSNAINFIDSAAVQFKTNIDSVKIILDYLPGTPPVAGERNRSGRILTVMVRDGNKPFKLFGESDVEFESFLKNYAVDGTKFNGSIVVKRKSKTEMRIKVKAGKASNTGWAQDLDFENEGERKLKWIKGPNHPTNDGVIYDEYEITDDDSNGKGCKGKSRDGLGYQMKIIKPLIYRTDSKYGIVDGEVELTPDGKKTRVISYAQIEQGIVTFTVDGNAFTIKLK
jgi:hypothetical protein